MPDNEITNFKSIQQVKESGILMLRALCSPGPASPAVPVETLVLTQPRVTEARGGVATAGGE